jgi:hypothetical protein
MFFCYILSYPAVPNLFFFHRHNFSHPLCLHRAAILFTVNDAVLSRIDESDSTDPNFCPVIESTPRVTLVVFELSSSRCIFSVAVGI